MKNIKYNIAIIICLFMLINCTDGFEDINSNEYKFTNEELKQDNNDVKGPIGTILNNIYKIDPVWQTQLQHNLNADLYSGYMMIPANFAGGVNNNNYALVDGWNGYTWSIAYESVMSNILRIKQIDEKSVFYGVALVLKVYNMQQVTDKYGPIVYSNYGTENSVIEYDTQEVAYNEMFKDLDKAVELLDANTSSKLLIGTDLTNYNGDIEKWIKFANSVRLRLAIRIVKINPTLAKTEAEKAINQSLSIIDANADNCVLNTVSKKHPLFTMTNAWNDICMSANMESYMVGYDDPRLPVYFTKATDENTSIKDKFKGIRLGISIATKDTYKNHSRLGSIVNTNTVTWFTAAEGFFLKAEGKLRGWDMGSNSVKELYELGISASFEQHGVTGSESYKISTNTPSAYSDPKQEDGSHNVPVGDSKLSTITVAWNDSATNEEKLEKIITQKWIAIFPDGSEAWAEFRRTGYPKVFPVVVNQSNDKIDTNTQIRRLNFPISEKTGNPEGYNTGVAKLGGEDNGGTRLWWDTGTANF